MAKTSEKITKSGTGTLDERQFYILFLIVGFVLAGVAYVTPLRNIFLSDFGLFANMAVLFYLLAFGYGIKGISAINMENWKSWRPLAIISFLALFMAAEELRWGLPFVLENTQDWPVERIRDFMSLSLVGIPEGSSLVLAGFLAGMRLALVLLILYVLGAAIFFRHKIPALWSEWRAKKALLYAGGFVLFLILMVLFKAGFLAFPEMFTGFLRMAAALSFLMLVLQIRPVSLK